jgi:hypothetical protein
MIKIEYSHHRDIDNIYFEGDWAGRMYINNTPKAGDIIYINNVENKNGVEITKSRIVQQEHSVRFVASSTMITVLQKLPLLSDVRFTVDSLEENKVLNLKFEIVNWLGGGAFALCKMSYTVYTYVSKNASI